MYNQRILFSYMYVVQKRSELSLPIEHPALVIFDRFKVQCTERILSLLGNNHIDIVIASSSCTDKTATTRCQRKQVSKGVPQKAISTVVHRSSTCTQAIKGRRSHVC